MATTHRKTKKTHFSWLKRNLHLFGELEFTYLHNFNSRIPIAVLGHWKYVYIHYTAWSVTFICLEIKLTASHPTKWSQQSLASVCVCGSQCLQWTSDSTHVYSNENTHKTHMENNVVMFGISTVLEDIIRAMSTLFCNSLIL